MAAVKWIFRLAIIGLIAAALHYSLPSRDVVRVLNTDVKREDVLRTDDQGNRVEVTRDVRYINSVEPDGDPRVYRNEDNAWYLKFDSANLNAEAENLASTENDPRWAVVTHYGWRIPFFSMFPNAISIRPASGPDEPLTPWMNIFIVSAIVIGLLLLRRFVLLMFRRNVDPVVEEIDRELQARGSAMGRFWRRLTGR